MSEGEVTMVELENLSSSTTTFFELSHAQRILEHPLGGWAVASNSPYTYEDGKGIIKRAVSGDTKKAKA